MFRNNKFLRWLIILICPLGFFLLMGLFLVDYHASYIFLLSIIVGILLQIIIILLKKIYSSRRVKIISFSLLILVISFFYISVSNLTSLLNVNPFHLFLVSPSSVELCPFDLDYYHLIVNYPNNNNNLKTLEVEEDVIPNKKNQTLFSQKKPIPINSKGSLVNEVEIKPLDIIDSEPNFAKYKPPECKNQNRFVRYDVKDTNKAIVELNEFPPGSFYKADNANPLTEPNTNLLAGHESIKLTIDNLERPIKFTYLLFPYNYLRVFLRPLLLFANKNPWIVFIGIIIGLNPQGISLMSQNFSRIINTTGGNYNESIGSNYIQGDHINTNQNSSKAVSQLKQSIDRDNVLTNPDFRNAVSSTNNPSPPVQNRLVCTNCGHNNLANLNFCTKCETKLNQPHI
ncbi:MAG: hypothetical protein DSM106950_42410 [Stigonema ocellatum SAG 48.90 = DSM 106950]|nr:hypothetical protein [Stigonema ocellatum SAG 48.90 = DSM 106950]